MKSSKRTMKIFRTARKQVLKLYSRKRCNHPILVINRFFIEPLHTIEYNLFDPTLPDYLAYYPYVPRIEYQLWSPHRTDYLE